MHDDLIVMTTASGIRGCGRRMGVIHNLRRVALDSAPVGHLDLSGREKPDPLNSIGTAE